MDYKLYKTEKYLIDYKLNYGGETLKNIVAISVFLFLLSIGITVDAHPGKTDSNGGHTCRTNCEKYGLDYGEYHTHNSGGSSSTTESNSSNSSTPKTQSNDKDCADFSSYDEVVEYWNSKGYSATYDPERLDGGGNTVDDGIPCEAPSGYDYTKINNSEQQIAAKAATQEKSKGESEGYKIGLEAGYNDKSFSDSITGTDAYVEGYKLGYKKGWDEGNKKLQDEKKKAETAGYELGKKQDQLTVPKEYSQNNLVKTSFEKGFESGVTERDEVKKSEFSQVGYEDGKKNTYNTPKDVKEIYVTAYEEGYQKGQKELKESYVKQGYDSAFTMLKYKEPKLEDEKFIQWYKEGFDSNKEVEEIANEGYELGLTGSTYTLPKKYNYAEIIFKHHYELGYKEYEKEKEENTQQATIGLGTVLIAWLGRRFYVAKKMIS